MSLALRLTYRAGDRTLTDEEVARAPRAIAAALADELGGRVRDCLAWPCSAPPATRAR